MDPDQALAEIRLLTTGILAGAYVSVGAPAHELAERIEALDDWLKVGGFLPKDWDKDVSVSLLKGKPIEK